MEDFLKLELDHRTVLAKDMETFRAVREFLVNSGYVKVYEVEKIGEKKTSMTTFAARNLITGDCLAIVYGMSESKESSHAHAPFDFGVRGKTTEELIYVQHLAVRTNDIFKLREHLESRGARFLTPVFEDKDFFGRLLQCFTRDLFEDDWFFMELVQRDYDPAILKGKIGNQFVNKTVRSLYQMKQDEFRTWLKTKKKVTMFDADKTEKEIRKFLEGFIPKDLPKSIPSLAKVYE